MPILPLGLPAKVNVWIVLKTYILSLWEPGQTETFIFCCFKEVAGWEAWVGSIIIILNFPILL